MHRVVSARWEMVISRYRCTSPLTSLIPLVIGDAKQLDGKKYRGKILFFFVIKSCYESLIFIDFINIFFESKFRVIFDKYYVSYFIFVICGNKFGLDSV